MLHSTLTELLQARSNASGKGIFFIEKNGKEEYVSYPELYNSALVVLFFLQQRGVQRGNELVLQVEDNKNFLVIFWACILGGIIPVPLAVSKTELNHQKFFNVWGRLSNPCLVVGEAVLLKTGSRIKDAYDEALFEQMNAAVLREEDIFSLTGIGTVYPAVETDIAFLQFSSGSTGASKGVVLTHQNLLANLDGISKAARYTEDDSMLSWMPLTHDMGLIGFHLNPLFSNSNQYLIPTALFVIHPSLWLDKCSEHRITITCSPNFGYNYVLKHASSYNTDTDLSCIRIIYNGAEPISFDLCKDFLKAFATYQLNPAAMCPVYGLAEASLAVSISLPENPVETIEVNRHRLSIGEKISTEFSELDKLSFVNVGNAITNMAFRITDRSNKVLPEGTVGIIQIKGLSVTKGYYNNSGATKEVLTEDEWLITGDTGFVLDNSLFVIGRIKDVLFVNGQNYYAHDLEKMAQEVEGIELNKIAVAGCYNAAEQKEENIAFVLYRQAVELFVPLARALNECINRKAGFRLDKILPVREIPKTTSGKLQRYRLAEQYMNGDFRPVEDSISRLTSAEETVHAADQLSNATEERVLTICSNLLKKKKIRPTDNFLESGGNSLLMATLSMVVLKEFGVELQVNDLYELHSIRDIANEIGKYKPASYKPMDIAPVQDTYGLSSFQEGIYHFCRLDPQSVCYNIPVAFRIRGDIDRHKLEVAFKQLLKRHQLLRTSFLLDGNGKMLVHEQADLTIKEISCAAGNSLHSLQSLVLPFDLESAPLLRVMLVRESGGPVYLMLDVHHLVADGVSVTKLLQELLMIYNGLILPVINHQYKDFCAWEKKRLQEQVLVKQKEFWHTYLTNELPVLEMPADYIRPALFSTKGKKTGFSLKAELFADIQKLAAKRNLSVHSFFFSAYALLLSKFSGQDELMIGIPVAGRNHPDLEDAIGMFVNSLPVRTLIDGVQGFDTFWRRQAEDIRTVLANQQYPFTEICNASTVKRDVGRNLLFDTMFIYQNMDIGFTNDNDFYLERIPLDPGISKYDISIEIIEEAGTAVYTIEYATSLFSDQTISRFSSWFEQLIVNIVQSPGSLIGDLSLVPKDHYDRYNQESIPTEFVLSPDETVARLWDTTCKKYPDREALYYKGQTITYQVLQTAVHAAAVYLTGKGIKTGSVVALLGKRSPDLIIAMLGVLKAGGCFLPIDTDLPSDRILFILQNSKCDILITDEENPVAANKEFNEKPEIIFFKNIAAQQTAESILPTASLPEDLCYILYTSGTTGEPKGTMIEHRSLLNYVEWAAKSYIRQSPASFPFFTSVSFDLTLTSIFVPLLTGNTVVIYDESASGFLLKEILEDNRVDIIKATPSHLRLLVKNFSEMPDSRVSAFIVGGEQLESDLAKRLTALFNNRVSIYNEYGPTEATIGCMIHEYNPDEPYVNVPIGVPAANTSIYVLDKYMKPVPEGINGELFIAGTGLARGYLFNEALTSAKFIENPFCKGGKMYRTGDIARRLDNGMIAYVGRYDEQVKINGHRIELSEIQQLIQQYPGIQEAVVLVRNISDDQKILVAFFTADQAFTDTISEERLKIYTAAKLPYYMVPAYFIRLSAIPLNQNKKTDTKTLANYGIGNNTRITTLPADETELQLLEIWRKVLRESELTVTDNFFEFGGDSIKAIQIVSAAMESGIVLAVKDILTGHTVKQVRLFAKRKEEGNTAVNKTETGFRDLSPVEKWFFEKEFKFPGAYNQSVLLKFHGAVSADLLTEALCNLVRQHDALRLNYDRVSGRMFFSDKPVRERICVLQKHIADTDPEVRIITEQSGLSDICFDLAADLLLRAAVVVTGSGSCYVYLVAHHLVTDGVSWNILLTDLQNFYQTLENNTDPVFPHKTTSVSDWLKYATAYSSNYYDPTAEKYIWSAEENAFVLPTDYSEYDNRVLHAGIVSRMVPKETTELIKRNGARLLNIDIDIALLVSLALAVQDWTGTSIITIETEGHGRSLPGIDISRTVGWFTEIYPVKLEVTGNNLIEQIKHIKEQVLEGRNHAFQYMFSRQNSNEGKSGRRSLPELLFNYLGEFSLNGEGQLFEYVNQGIHVYSHPENLLTAKIEINAMVYGGALMIEATYNTSAYRHDTICDFLDKFIFHMENISQELSDKNEIHYTPSDFKLVKLTSDELDSLFN